ncbi:MAG TPA: DUF4304 domain-containing protein, partial [Polyangiaceae bacterium]|nr:DUF4304 domain-containing protein [Polyangiaceae bacterium]
QVVHVQGSSSGEACCVNLGTHFTFLPTTLENPADPQAIREPDCEFRWRLATPDDRGDHWWDYGYNEFVAERSVQHLVSTYEAFGVSALEEYRNFPAPFDRVTPDMVARGDLRLLPGAPTTIRTVLALARISLHCSRFGAARDFANLGLSMLTERGSPSSLLPKFRDLAEKLRQTAG